VANSRFKSCFLVFRLTKYINNTTYSLRPILLFANTDVSTTKICLGTSTLTKSIMGRREYINLVKMGIKKVFVHAKKAGRLCVLAVFILWARNYVCIMYWTSRAIFIVYKYIIYMTSFYKSHNYAKYTNLKSNLHLFVVYY
jgi:hypothetical protein